MKMLTRGIFVLACCTLVFSCSRGVSYRIAGTWENGEGKKIYLSEIVGNKEFRAVDSAVVAPDFTFLLKGNVDRVQKMVLVYNSDKRKEIIVDGEPMNVMFEETTKEWKGKTSTSVTVTCTGNKEQEFLEQGSSLKTTISFMQLG